MKAIARLVAVLVMVGGPRRPRPFKSHRWHWRLVARTAAVSALLSSLVVVGTSASASEGAQSTPVVVGNPTALNTDAPVASDGMPVTNITGLATTYSGTTYFTVAGLQRVKRFDPRTGLVTTVAGSGSFTAGGFSGDYGQATAAMLDGPKSLAVEPGGTVLYVADLGNQRIRRINLITGVIDSVRGLTGDPITLSASGIASTANSRIYVATSTQFVILDQQTYGWGFTARPASSPLVAVAASPQGDGYFADASNTIYRVPAQSRNAYLFAGNGTAGYSGDGGDPRNASFDRIDSLLADQSSLFIAHRTANGAVIRKISDIVANYVFEVTTGTVSTVAGGGNASLSSAVGAAELAGPFLALSKGSSGAMLVGGAAAFASIAPLTTVYAPRPAMPTDQLMYSDRTWITTARPDATEVVRRFQPGCLNNTGYLSPDGTKVAYLGSGGGAYGCEANQRTLVVADLNGTNRLTLQTSGEVRWSPDGQWIATFGAGTGCLTITRPDGSETRLLKCPVQGSGFAWAPDSQSIAYSVEENTCVTVHQSIKEINVDGTGDRYLFRPCRSYDDIGVVTDWGPAGILTAKMNEGGQPWVGINLFDPVTGSFVNMWRQGAVPSAFPRFSPDGAWVLFSSSQTGQSNTYIAPLVPRAIPTALPFGTELAGPNFSPVRFDSQPPAVTGTPDREPDSNGWYNAPVSITWAAHDPSPSSGTPTTPAPTTVSGDGADQMVTSDPSCDPAGNCATGTYTLSVDSTPPTITPELSGVVGENGWYTSPVMVHFACTDSLSGVTTCPVDQTVSQDGITTVTGTAVDGAGNNATASIVVKLDGTAPGGSMDPTSGVHRPGQAITGTATDVGSGVATVTLNYAATSPLAFNSTAIATLSCDLWGASCSWSATGPSGALFGFLPATYSVTATITDQAGNTATTPPRTILVA